MSYVMYLRKSRADQEAEARGEGETLARHQVTLIDTAKRMNLDVTAIYKEIVSGDTIAARPEMQKLISEVSAGMWEGVLVMEVERLARGETIDQGIVAQAFKYSNTKIITPYKTYDPSNEFDETFFEFNLFMSRQEYKTIRRRMQAGKETSAKEGNFLVPDAPYGYKVVSNGRHDRTLEIVPEEAEVIRMIFDMYINKGMGYTAIASKLNSLHIAKNNGTYWTNQNIGYIVRNPTYCGKIRWNFRPTKKIIAPNGERLTKRTRDWDAPYYDGKHMPIISEETWLQAKNVHDGKGHLPIQKNKKMANPYAGIMFCSECGKNMQFVRNNTKWNSVGLLRCPSSMCKTVSSSIETIDDIIYIALQDKYNSLQEYQGKPKPKNNARDTAIKNAKAELAKTEQQRLKLYDLLEQGVYSVELFTERINELKRRTAELTEIINASPEPEDTLTIRQAKISLKKALKDFDTASVEEKHALLTAVISKIKYSKSKQYSDSDLTLDIEYRF